MTFDLYGTTAAPRKPAKTTLDELAAATWQQLPSGRWQLMWDDRTPDYGDQDGTGGYFTCELYGHGKHWAYDYWHSERGGEQLYNGIEYDGENAFKALDEVRNRMVHWIDAWTYEQECAAARAERGEDE